jgi:hypothetical protein
MLQQSSSRKHSISTIKLHHALAGTTAISLTGRNNLLSPTPTADRTTTVADISGGTRMLFNPQSSGLQ